MMSPNPKMINVMKCTMLLLNGNNPEKYPAISVDGFKKACANPKNMRADCIGINPS